MRPWQLVPELRPGGGKEGMKQNKMILGKKSLNSGLLPNNVDFWFAFSVLVVGFGLAAIMIE